MAKGKRRRGSQGPGAQSPRGSAAEPTLPTPANPRRPRKYILFGLIAMAALVAAAVPLTVWWYAKPRPPAVAQPASVSVSHRPPDPAAPAYVTSAPCAECHAKQHREWIGSHHDLAMQPATAQTVRGNFNDVRVSDRGVTSRFFTRDGRFFVNTEGPDGKPADFEVRYTFGLEPLQQYLVEFPGGRLQALTMAWDTKKMRWFPLYPTERFAPDDPLHWTGRYQNWNAMCADCHSTDLRKNYDPAADTYRTAWSEVNVGCQACHGPGEAHVAWARGARDKAAAPAADGLLVHLKRGDARAEIDTCAPCHSPRSRLVGDGQA